MSHLLVPPLPPTPPQQEETPFYGWRYLRRHDANGREYLEEVPLTLEDVLYPQEGDEVPMRPQHRIECAYLANVLTTRFAGDPLDCGAVLLSDRLGRRRPTQSRAGSCRLPRSADSARSASGHV